MSLVTLTWILSGFGFCMALLFVAVRNYRGTRFFFMFGVGGAILIVFGMVIRMVIRIVG